MDELKKGALISRGGSSWVHHGIWKDKPVAIKEINPGEKNNQKWLNETKILTLLGSHPSIIQLFHAIPDSRCLVLEVGKIELRQRLFPISAMSTIEWKVRMQFAAQIAAGLIYIQGRNIAHLDLNLENIVIMAGEETVKIIDFERAVHLQHADDIHESRYTFGTPGYMAPEASEGRYSFKSDVYSFGKILWGLVVYKDPRKSEIDYALPTEFAECTAPQKLFLQSFWKQNPKERPAMVDALPETKKLFAIK